MQFTLRQSLGRKGYSCLIRDFPHKSPVATLGEEKQKDKDTSQGVYVFNGVKEWKQWIIPTILKYPSSKEGNTLNKRRKKCLTLRYVCLTVAIQLISISKKSSTKTKYFLIWDFPKNPDFQMPQIKLKTMRQKKTRLMTRRMVIIPGVP